MTLTVGTPVIVTDSLIHTGVGPSAGARLSGVGVIDQVDENDPAYRYAVKFSYLCARLVDGTVDEEHCMRVQEEGHEVWVQTASVMAP